MNAKANQRRRQAFLRGRARAGLGKPAAVAVVAANADSVSAGTARATRIVREAGDEATILGVVEAADVRVANVLKEFDVFQGCASYARRATAIAVRRDRGRIDHAWVRRTVRPVINGRRVRMRSRYSVGAWITLDPLSKERWRIKVKVGHNAPPRYAALQPRWLSRFGAGGADVMLGDGNVRRSRLQRALRRKVRQVPGDVMFVACRWWIPAERVRRIKVEGADHDMAGTILWSRSGDDEG